MSDAQINHSERAHAVLSASGAERWMNCTPSARMEEELPEETSDYAEEGTLAHEISQTLLLHRAGKRTKADHNKIMKGLIDNKHYYLGMIDDVEPYVNLILEQISTDKNSSLYVEEKLDLTEYIPEGYGTNDASVIANGILHVTDLKFGKGIRVSAEDNSQLKLYGLGALLRFEMIYDIHTVRLTIVQPRLDAVSVWDISTEDLMTWAEKHVKTAAATAWAGKGDHKTGDWCKFCKAKVFCPALKKEALALAQEDFAEKINKEETYNRNLTKATGFKKSVYSDAFDAEILNVYKLADRVSDYLNAVKDHVYKKALGGKKWKGYKLVAGKSNRVITDEDKAINILREAGFDFNQLTNTNIKGIGDLEKTVGKKELPNILGKLLIKPAGKPALVEESDSRQEINSADDFITDEEDSLL